MKQMKHTYKINLCTGIVLYYPPAFFLKAIPIGFSFLKNNVGIVGSFNYINVAFIIP